MIAWSFRSRHGAIALAATLGGFAVGACSDSGDDGSPGPGLDGGAVLPAHDAGLEPEAAPADAGGDAATKICSDQGFCHSELPPKQHLRGVWGDGQGVVWAMSLEGNILRWDGAEWKVHTRRIVEDEGLFALWGTGPTDVWVASSAGLLHGTGASSAAIVFEPVDLPGDASIPIKSVWGTGPNDIWAAGGIESFDDWPPHFAGRIVHFTGPTDAGGAGWTLDDASREGVAFRAVFGSATSGVWTHGTTVDEFGNVSARVLRRTPGSSKWTELPLPADPGGGWRPEPQEITAAALSSDTSLWLAGSTGNYDRVRWHGKATAGGASFDWTLTKALFGDRPAYAFWGLSPNETWAVGESGLVSRWDGAKWSQAVIRVSEVPVAKSFWAIWRTSHDDFWIVGDEVALHKTKQGKP
ncbi:MAG: hypothetical protein KF764_18910 [Labilithrix sp.]|nr:hypothetical protein [Labilithrix sp.]